MIKSNTKQASNDYNVIATIRSIKTSGLSTGCSSGCLPFGKSQFCPGHDLLGGRVLAVSL